MIPWEIFVDGLRALGKNPQLSIGLEWGPKAKDGQAIRKPTVGSGPNGFLNATQMHSFRNQICARRQLLFSQVLLSCHRFVATEKRDKVFGILGMSLTR
jgi:hypothetical protein